MDLNQLSLFASAALLLNLSPGPDLLYVTSNSIVNGRRVGIAAAGGIAVGAMFHVTLAALGISALLAASEVAFSIVKWLGAGYLVYLGVQTIRSAQTNTPNADTQAISPAAAFRQGVVIDLMNPKPAIFFMAFLPQFVSPSWGAVSIQLAFLGTAVVMIGFVVEAIAALVASKFSKALRAKQKFKSFLDYALGSILIALGVRLAFQQRV